jgi:HEAT repeat protein
MRTAILSALILAALGVAAPAGENGKAAPSGFEGEPESSMPIPELPAFPGAEGYGARSIGGRGGKVLKVTNLNADGPGSLQWACAQKGPRIVVFEVSGLIPCSRSSKGKKFLAIDYPDITIAGQTAPGAGITIDGAISTLRGYSGARKQYVNNVIVRFMRARPNPARRGNVRSMEMSMSDRVILDHCSGCWSLDDCYDLYTARDVTVQWCTAEESDIQLEGGDEPHDFGMIFGYGHRSKTIHHTLLANHRHRNPLVGTYPTDFRNNVVHNGGNSMNYIIKGSIADSFIMNLVGNYSSPGPGGIIGPRIYIPPYVSGRAGFVVPSKGKAKIYRVGNYHPWGEGYTKNSTDNKFSAHSFSEREFRFPPVKTHTAEEACRLVVAQAGCLPRDVVTRRTIREVLTGGGGWGRFGPEGSLLEGLTPGKAPADTDKDGVPDEWEKTHGMDPADAADAAKVVPAGASPGDRHKGYTYIEYYINDAADTRIAEALTAARLSPVPAEPWERPAKKLAPHAMVHKSVEEMVAAIREQTHDKGRDTLAGWFAVQQFSRMGDKGKPAVPELVKILLDKSEKRRATFAAWALGAIGPDAKEAVPALMKAADMKYDDVGKTWKPWYIHGFIAWALGKIGPEAKESVPTLVKIMGGPCQRSQPAATWALGRMGTAAKPAEAALLKKLGDRYCGYYAAHALAAIGESTVPGLTKSLAGGNSRAADALRDIGEKAAGATSALSAALSHADPHVRVAAARALGAVGPKAASAAPALAKALGDEDFNVRHAAAAALGKLGPAAGGQAKALSAAAADKRREVSRAAVLSLGGCGKAGAGELVGLLSGDKDAFVRKYAARALGDAKEGADALSKALADADPEVRREAVWSLGLIGPGAKGAQAALKKAVAGDVDYVVRFAAGEALKRIGG